MTCFVAAAISVFFILATMHILVLIFINDHKYSGALLHLIAIGCTYAGFCVLYVLKKQESPFYEITSYNDFYAFSVTFFSTSAVIVIAYMTLKRKSTMLWYSVYHLLPVCIIIGMDKLLRTCTCIEGDCNLSISSLQITKNEGAKITPSVYCFYNTIDHDSAIIFVEYLLIYVPAYALLYTKIRKSATLNDWFCLPSREKCRGCELNVSLCLYTVIGFSFVIWCIRPMYLITAALGYTLFDVQRKHDIIPCLSIVAVHGMVLISMLKIYISLKYHVYQNCLKHRKENITVI